MDETKGRQDAIWAEKCGELGDVRLMPIAFGGQCYYVRRCKTPDVIGGIEIPVTAQEYSDWFEVVGVGPNVNKPCSKEQQRQFKRARHIVDVAEVGDLVLCPRITQNNTHTGVRRSPVCWDYEAFIEISVPRAIWKQRGRESEREPCQNKTP